jgi:outer membrane protein
VADEALRTARADVERARNRVAAGVAVESDLLAAQVQLAEFTQQRIQAEGQRATALAALNIVMGAAANAPRRLTLALRKRSFAVAELEDLLSRAAARRPDYRQAQASVNIAERRIAEQRSSYLPEVSVFGSVGASGRHPFAGSADYTIGAGLAFNVFDLGRPARAAQAEVNRQLAEAERDRVLDQIRLEVTGAYHRYRSAEQQVEVAEAALAQAMEGLRIVQDRYDAGLTTITEVLRAETAVVRSQMNVATSIHAQYLGYAGVLFVSGELTGVEGFEP